jgi:hypothetical protein
MGLTAKKVMTADAELSAGRRVLPAWHPDTACIKAHICGKCMHL